MSRVTRFFQTSIGTIGNLPNRKIMTLTRKTNTPTASKPTTDAKERCAWAARGGELMVAYHDTEWGVPVHDDQKQFEFLTLESAQAGLSWSIVLRKRNAYRQAFADFDPAKVARFTAKRIEELIVDPGIIRNRLKILAAVTNAQSLLDVQEEFGSFDKYIWNFVGGRPIQNRLASIKHLPA